MKKAQASLEYFIIFAVIAALTLISAATFLPQVREAAEDLFNKAAGRISNADKTTVTPPAEPPTTPPPPALPPEGVFPLPVDPMTGITPWLHLYPCEENVYFVKIEEGKTYLRMSLAGGTMDTLATFTFTSPDGSVLPTGGGEILGMDFGGAVALRAQGTPYANIPDQYIPAGYYILRIKGDCESQFDSYFKVLLETE